ncbi:hypothetical protein BJ973_001983 [Actinoplanes tereljensis]|uniref:TIR domain-containing protein n=1 Tax=Paractinoplanes tereljensis TaxID=571912 RepID=A0A919NLF1_9ACTN|nr:TIR domain-containing protein [Actinoplanes tereljensis]GIF20111.1 hypothetical protein Ate02nite_28410 [Actinoplanes tereljensis]
MPIALPGPDKVPAGPHRDLILRLHELYQQAGMPSTRIISRWTMYGQEPVSHQTVGAALRGPGLPGWAKLQAIVVVLCQRSISPRNSEYELSIFHDLYTRAGMPAEPLQKPTSASDIVFISYSVSDKNYVDRLADSLLRAGIDYRFMVDFVAGATDRAVRQQIDECAALIAVMSPGARAALHVEREIEHALARNKPVLPVLVAGKIWLPISTVDFFDARDGQLPDQRFIDNLRELLGGSAPVALTGLSADEPADRTQPDLPDLPWPDRDIVEFLWARLTSMRDDLGPEFATEDNVVGDINPMFVRDRRMPELSVLQDAVREVLDAEVPAVEPGGMAEVVAGRRDDPAVRCHLIFWNVSRAVDIQMFAPELMRRAAALIRERVEHLVVFSLSSPIDPELRDVEHGPYPFGVTFFGPDDVAGPDDLRRVLRRRTVLPPEWRDYAAAPARLCLRGESPTMFDETFAHQLPMRARNEAGSLLDGDLLAQVRDWFDAPGEPTLLLTGDFGDGKSFFTYNLARRLCAEGARIPVRLALGELRSAGSGRDLLKRRLEDLGIELASWRRLVESRPTLVILDGFDEMSGDLSRTAIVENIELLRDCCEEFAESKVLITSRTNVFGTADDQRQLLERIGRPRILRLAAVERRVVLRSLRDRSADPKLQRVIDRLQTLHDPIGLATKPLYYEMIQRTLPSLPDMSFDEHVLYEQYVLDTLHRKLKFLEDEARLTPPEDVVEKLMTILEQVAIDLQHSDQPFVYLKDLGNRVRKHSGGHAGLANLLWRLRDDADPGHLEDDATARVGVRSLLKRAPGGDDKRWPVTFFHRSMREYFVARAMARNIGKGPVPAQGALGAAPLSPEIRHFATLVLRAHPDWPVADTLLSVIRQAGPDATAAGGNALSLLAALGGPLPGRDWSNLRLDHADLHGADLREMSFRGSSLRGANLDNADLTGADLRDADLTGVRLEETAAVTAVAVLDEGRIFAAYDDGRVREWSSASRATSDTVIATLPFVADRLWPLPHGALVAAGGARVAVLSGDPDWRLVTEFRTQSRYLSPVWRNGRALIVVEDKTGSRVALWQDPLTGQRRRVDCATTTAWAVDGDRVMAVASPAGAAVTIGRETVTIVGHVPRSVDVRAVGDEIEVLVGTDIGEVAHFRLVQAVEGWRLRLHWRAALHEGPVESVCFLGADRVVSGSRDRSICVVPLHDATPANAVRLHVRFRCRDTKIDGVRGERERTMLERLASAR